MRAAVVARAIHWLTIRSHNVSIDPVIPADMQAALEAFGHSTEKIIVSFVGSLDSMPPPPMIYHDTNDTGLRGILETGKIWLADIFNLNDPSELSHGFSHIVATLKEMAVSGPPQVNIFARETEAFATQGDIRAAAHYFVCSFSAAGDDLVIALSDCRPGTNSASRRLCYLRSADVRRSLRCEVKCSVTVIPGRPFPVESTRIWKAVCIAKVHAQFGGRRRNILRGGVPRLPYRDPASRLFRDLRDSVTPAKAGGIEPGRRSRARQFQ
jgi:hypothetical protein